HADLGRRKRDLDCEHGPLARALLDEEAAAHPRSDRSADVEADAHAGLTRAARAANEALKDTLALGRVDPRALIAYPNERVLGLDARRDLDQRYARAGRLGAFHEDVEEPVDARRVRPDE